MTDLAASDPVAAWAQHLADLREQWARLPMTARRRWDGDAAAAELARLQAEQRWLTGAGLWRGGPTTLLEVLGLQWDELAMVRTLEWLLRPDGHHGLGDHLLRAAAVRAGAAEDADLSEVRMLLEESRATQDVPDGDRSRTRADLVVYTRGVTLVIEAKVLAAEQPEQLDRLRRTWQAEPGARFLFVTRDHPVQLTSAAEGPWHELTWSEIADVVDAHPSSSPEVRALVNAYRRL